MNCATKATYKHIEKYAVEEEEEEEEGEKEKEEEEVKEVNDEYLDGRYCINVSLHGFL